MASLLPRRLALRISLILAGAMGLLVLALGGVLYQQRQSSDAPLRLPLPEQAAAIVELIELMPPEHLPQALKALNTSQLEVTVSEQVPALSQGNGWFPMVSWLVQRYVGKLGDRVVQVGGDGQLLDQQSFQIVVRSRDGRYITLRTHRDVLQRILWMRWFSVLLVLLLVIGGGSLWLLNRQIRPLESLVQAVERFGERVAEQPLAEQGAPEIRSLVLAFNHMQARIRRLVEGQSRMFAAISHDLGTYLTRLRLRVEYLADDHQRERAIRDIEQMQILMTDTLTLARLEHGAEPLGRVNLSALVARQVAGFREVGSSVDWKPCAPLWVHGSVAALGRAIANLVANALKYAGAAELTLHAAGDKIELRVEDRGPGIPPALRDLVLEPFYRADGARNLDTPGSGLGLAIVVDIVRRHDGSLLLGDREGGGLRVTVTLPADTGR